MVIPPCSRGNKPPKSSILLLKDTKDNPNKGNELLQNLIQAPLRRGRHVIKHGAVSVIGLSQQSTIPSPNAFYRHKDLHSIMWHSSGWSQPLPLPLLHLPCTPPPHPLTNLSAGGAAVTYESLVMNLATECRNHRHQPLGRQWRLCEGPDF